MFLRFLHLVSSAGMLGALAAHAVLLAGTTALEAAQLVAVRQGIQAVTRYLLMPSLVGVMLSGLLAIAAHRPFHNAGWVWVKAATGALLLEGTLGAVVGTARRGEELARQALTSEAPADAVADALRHEWGGLAVIAALSMANVVLGVWRPKLTRRKGVATAG